MVLICDAWEVHGSGPLLSNLCKSIAIDEDDEDDEDGEAEHKPQWKKDLADFFLDSKTSIGMSH